MTDDRERELELRDDERDPDLLPVRLEEFLTREQAERDPTVDLHERDHPGLRPRPPSD